MACRLNPPMSMIYFPAMMTRINIAEAKSRLSNYLERVERGETIILCRRNVPIAEIRPVAKRLEEPRPVGIDRGMTIPPSFFEPLPDNVIEGFEGSDSAA